MSETPTLTGKQRQILAVDPSKSPFEGGGTAKPVAIKLVTKTRAQVTFEDEAGRQYAVQYGPVIGGTLEQFNNESNDCLTASAAEKAAAEKAAAEKAAAEKAAAEKAAAEKAAAEKAAAEKAAADRKAAAEKKAAAAEKRKAAEKGTEVEDD